MTQFILALTAALAIITAAGAGAGHHNAPPIIAPMDVTPPGPGL